uniref:Uncharacterized protein n=1 Tax=Chromera velia CCMP2878 TaxID=1169474 RepID=A0A0G4G173_9ALVE|eukprot:Cvel_4045.t1-p1 / transcript=Cvel_4045.t1 / gene=Cvel_4045 / organism=Chromera_velia_CCMP2878 / gene_product=hypothetical protein / transcript_product=hypothetical protein / location=Cvel_scaffold172:25355-33649(-) / protein_length=189 / sequence_SO=supercontig / SO=protein_coding / is_pseudo=false
MIGVPRKGCLLARVPRFDKTHERRSGQQTKRSHFFRLMPAADEKVPPPGGLGAAEAVVPPTAQALAKLNKAAMPTTGKDEVKTMSAEIFLKTLSTLMMVIQDVVQRQAAGKGTLFGRTITPTGVLQDEVAAVAAVTSLPVKKNKITDKDCILEKCPGAGAVVGPGADAVFEGCVFRRAEASSREKNSVW